MTHWGLWKYPFETTDDSNGKVYDSNQVMNQLWVVLSLLHISPCIRPCFRSDSGTAALGLFTCSRLVTGQNMFPRSRDAAQIGTLWFEARPSRRYISESWTVPLLHKQVRWRDYVKVMQCAEGLRTRPCLWLLRPRVGLNGGEIHEVTHPKFYHFDSWSIALPYFESFFCSWFWQRQRSKPYFFV